MAYVQCTYSVRTVYCTYSACTVHVGCKGGGKQTDLGQCQHTGGCKEEGGVDTHTGPAEQEGPVPRTHAVTSLAAGARARMRGRSIHKWGSRPTAIASAQTVTV